MNNPGTVHDSHYIRAEMSIMSRWCALILILVVLPIACVSSSASHSLCQKDHEFEDHPVLCEMLAWAERDVDGFADYAHAWANQHGLLVGDSPFFSLATGSHDDMHPQIKKRRMVSSVHSSPYPVVLAHGMGDSCFNSGLQHISQHISDLLDTYSICIPTGKTRSEDTKNGYFLSMDASVDVFAQAVRSDPQLAQGFYATGFSQGNNVIRGYITRYNAPPVHGFISINGVNAGTGAVPYCLPHEERDSVAKLNTKGTNMCDLLMEQASRGAYTEFAQEHSFQANYWRDPRPVAKERYEKFSQLARWNNEGHHNSTYNANWAKTSKFVWVEALDDEMVWPHEGEQWGAPDPKNPFRHILPRNETEWFIHDLFGLRTAEEAGKNYDETFDGDHLQFTMKDFDRWLTTYFN
jgi:palmitoyl-protein thioesterase